MRVLFVTPWYPNRYDSMIGFFVHNHAAAVVANSQCEIGVLSVCFAATCDGEEIVQSERDGVVSLILYHNNPAPLAEIKLYKKLLDKWLDRFWTPNVVHCHIASKSSLVGVYLKRTKGIPFVLSEHFSGYLPQNYAFNSPYRKGFINFIIRQADKLIVVSDYLKKAMEASGFAHPNSCVVGNVCAEIFYEEHEHIRSQVTHFVHISCFDNKAKNITGILDALKKVDGGEMTIIGDGADYELVMEHCKALRLEESVHFVGVKQPHEVVEELRRCDAVVQFSNYETAGIVLEEAAASGVPIISTPVGIAPEIVNEQTGVLVDCGDTEALADAMKSIVAGREFDATALRTVAKQYHPKTIAKKIVEIYKNIS